MSDSDSEASLRSASSRASSVDSVDSASPALSLRYGADVVRDAPVEVITMRLQREQKLRRVLSQRHLGQPEAIADNAFFCTRSALAEEDVVWLYSLTNHNCFEQLLREVTATTSSLAGHLDAVLSNANPLFYFNYGMPIEAARGATEADKAGEDGGNDEGTPFLRESPFMQRWSRERCAIQRKRPVPEELEKSASAPPGTDARSDRAGGARKTAKKSSSASTSSGLVAQSMMAWEAHLTASLTQEGETIENFRQARSKSSYTEKKSFQRQAEWNEFEREVALQQQQRDRAATRALRRGEVDE
ncbi:hypothetical protein ABB37_09248 [Leptomonas pyrrhocoris]|uniref:BCNT-C domain-containing protein n=1 Tax=Leptomonas pyrrhocoris TaxID=157538 RepID=A0A0M9FR16_LEPPY|nr:hypothetical protein ABB37_09248 [Leptomonas pyrrhocoris]XP_015652672.1 hypothetical protein ABB37_09248 [Leptomonas pyrrhocoris]XP_015652673.1 hypothetical protein ABB37_09248 [Leptomonas pyrrhocoris]KPA74232.1 hypothetical protein ABB37_09248 [Leptomonas pyrrhocoris]KPA74233.1 hypothetical protein ABB37_09248 [Leptomonas pyrrhocoris]KPA74234.1 hypothetical protein ABB37_09248 [Leptomonas pyrrhocoris]|eukprot:XP_015652671.1 hypothetical protein ABB37_09248 [Leptomonas pyrrhocoris]